MKGYLTVFLALSLSIITGFILMLTGNAIRNSERVRLECAADTGMNAVLSEFHAGLLERYDLIYVDASYLGKQPSIANVEERLRYYTEENTSQIFKGSNKPWGRLSIENTAITSVETAAADNGGSMRNQAVLYIEDAGISGKEREMPGLVEEVRTLDCAAPMEDWIEVMGQIAGIELPKIQNEDGVWEEVPLSNPADWVYALAGSDILYLSQMESGDISPAKISVREYISHRENRNDKSAGRQYREDEELFLSYLFDKMGYFGNTKEASLLACQLEYVAMGKESDLDNMRAVAERLLKWRFADNVSQALADGRLRAEAAQAAEQLLAVTLKGELRTPVIESILYACAFLESICDVRTLLAGGEVPLKKAGHSMSVEHVLSGGFYAAESGAGLTYGQYLAGMILLMDAGEVNLRAMDIMEMDIRAAGIAVNGAAGGSAMSNKNFSMDWCIERFEAEITGTGGSGSRYFLKRKYGYF